MWHTVTKKQLLEKGFIEDHSPYEKLLPLGEALVKRAENMKFEISNRIHRGEQINRHDIQSCWEQLKDIYLNG